MGSPQFGDGVLAPEFLFLAISVHCLPAHPPAPGNFQGWGSAPGAPSLEISQRRRAGGGAQWEGGASLGAQEANILLLPRVSGSYFLINWERCSFAGDFQMFPFSSRRPRGRIPHGYGNYCRQWSVGQTPAVTGKGGP